MVYLKVKGTKKGDKCRLGRRREEQDEEEDAFEGWR